MKKTSKLVVALLAGCMLAGCQSTTNNIASLNSDYTLTADSVYEDLMKTSTGKNAVFSYIVEEIITANYPVSDAMKTDVDLTIEQIKNNYTAQYGADAEAQLLVTLGQYGYESVEDYRNAMIYSYQMQEFLGDYIKKNYDEIFADYMTNGKPRYVSHILVKMTDPENPTAEETEKLETVKKALANGQDFAEVAKTYSDDGSASNGGALGLCDTSTNFVTSFKEVMLELNEGEVSEPTKSEYGYHIITVTSTKEEDIKADEDTLMDSLMAYDSEIIYKALLNYEITFNDESIKELYESTLNQYISTTEGSAS